MNIEIDKNAGFCFGVTNAIAKAEQELTLHNTVYCLNDIVHNGQENKRLSDKGMRIVSYSDFERIAGSRLLIRAHGEPPQTYAEARRHNISIIDATCPVVLKLQQKIKHTYTHNPGAAIVIFGKKGHAEVNGLVGQTDDNALVINNLDEARRIDVCRPMFLFSQTTSDNVEYHKVCDFLRSQFVAVFGSTDGLFVNETICPRVRNRVPLLVDFCRRFDVVIFVSDNNSSNGKMLFRVCLANNSVSRFISSLSDLRPEWFAGVASVGISGATSTPWWLMERVRAAIEKIVE